MSGIAELSWRAYPAVALMLLGLWLLLRGVRRCAAAWPRPTRGLVQPAVWMRGFRTTVVGLALAGSGAAWLWQIGWLLAASLIIGLGETLESSLDIDALEREQGTGESFGTQLAPVPCNHSPATYTTPELPPSKLIATPVM